MVAGKIKIAFYFIENSINKADENLGVERKSIMKLREQLPELTKVPSKSKTKTLHKRKKSKCKWYRRWISWMNFNELIIRYFNYFMGSDN